MLNIPRLIQAIARIISGLGFIFLSIMVSLHIYLSGPSYLRWTGPVLPQGSPTTRY